MSEKKPFAPSAERNKEAILQALKQWITPGDRVFEFGSGTGQHACHIAKAMPDTIWQPSDLAPQLPGINQWIRDSACTNIYPPIEVDLQQKTSVNFDASVCYSANTLHIVSWKLVCALFNQAAEILGENGKLIIYGPFKVAGQHTSDGNAQFDNQLRTSDPLSGIRDLNDLDKLAMQCGFDNSIVVNMPANNKLLCWEQCGSR